MAATPNLKDHEVEQKLLCPYDHTHESTQSKLLTHVEKCRLDHKALARNLVTCPYNKDHRIPKIEMELHTLLCPCKSMQPLEEPAAPTSKPANVIPFTLRPISTSENWDTEIARSRQQEVFEPEEPSLTVRPKTRHVPRRNRQTNSSTGRSGNRSTSNICPSMEPVTDMGAPLCSNASSCGFAQDLLETLPSGRAKVREDQDCQDQNENQAWGYSAHDNGHSPDAKLRKLEPRLVEARFEDPNYYFKREELTEEEPPCYGNSGANYVPETRSRPQNKKPILELTRDLLKKEIFFSDDEEIADFCAAPVTHQGYSKQTTSQLSKFLQPIEPAQPPTSYIPEKVVTPVYKLQPFPFEEKIGTSIYERKPMREPSSAAVATPRNAPVRPLSNPAPYSSVAASSLWELPCEPSQSASQGLVPATASYELRYRTSDCPSPIEPPLITSIQGIPPMYHPSKIYDYHHHNEAPVRIKSEFSLPPVGRGYTLNMNKTKQIPSVRGLMDQPPPGLTDDVEPSPYDQRIFYAQQEYAPVHHQAGEQSTRPVPVQSTEKYVVPARREGPINYKSPIHVEYQPSKARNGQKKESVMTKQARRPQMTQEEERMSQLNVADWLFNRCKR